MRREMIFRKPIHAGPLVDCVTVEGIFFEAGRMLICLNYLPLTISPCQPGDGVMSENKGERSSMHLLASVIISLWIFSQICDV